jgi:hypothetical protein
VLYEEPEWDSDEASNRHGRHKHEGKDPVIMRHNCDTVILSSICDHDGRSPPPHCRDRPTQEMAAAAPLIPNSSQLTSQNGKIWKNQQLFAAAMDPMDDNNADLVRIEHNEPRHNIAGEVPQPVDVQEQPLTLHTLIEQCYSAAVLEEIRSELRHKIATYEARGDVSITPCQLLALILYEPERNLFIEALSLKRVYGVHMSFILKGAPFALLESRIMDLVHRGRWTAEDMAGPFTALAKGLGGVKSLRSLSASWLPVVFVPALASIIRECQQVTDFEHLDLSDNAHGPNTAPFQTYMHHCLMDHSSINDITLSIDASLFQEVCSTLATLPKLRSCFLRGSGDYASAVRILSDGATEALCQLLSSKKLCDFTLMGIGFGEESAERVGHALVTSSISFFDIHAPYSLSSDVVAAIFRNSRKWKIEYLAIALAEWNETIEDCLSSYVTANKSLRDFSIWVLDGQVTSFQSESLLAAIDCPKRGHVRLSVAPLDAVDEDWNRRLEHVLAMNKTRKVLKHHFDTIEDEKSPAIHRSFSLRQALLRMNQSMLLDFLRRNERHLQELLRRLWPQENDDETSAHDNLADVEHINGECLAPSISSDE